MSTGWPIEARLALIQDIHELVKSDERVTKTKAAQVDGFWITHAILNDGTYSCTPQHKLISVLKNSPVWVRLKCFLVREDSRCATKGCNCDVHKHFGKTGKCSGKHHRYTTYNGHRSEKCKCQAFEEKVF